MLYLGWPHSEHLSLIWQLCLQILRVHEQRIKSVLILAVGEADIRWNDDLLIAVEVQIVFVYLYVAEYHWRLRHG